MAHSRSRMLTHLVFSTKNRSSIIDDTVRKELHSYISGTIKNDGSLIVAIGSVEDHVHILFDLSKNKTLTDSVRAIKASSSKWIKSKSRKYESFLWQNGYGAFSVSHSKIDDIIHYIKNQKEHHHKMTFKEELKILFDKHGIDYDERFL